MGSYCAPQVQCGFAAELRNPFTSVCLHVIFIYELGRPLPAPGGPVPLEGCGSAEACTLSAGAGPWQVPWGGPADRDGLRKLGKKAHSKETTVFLHSLLCKNKLNNSCHFSKKMKKKKRKKQEYQ